MTPSLEWDHTVHYVNDLDAAIAGFGSLGLRAFRGGSHTTWGTHNALSYFGLTYHEFLAIEDRGLVDAMDRSNLVVHDAAQLLPAHQRLHRVALRTNDIAGVLGAWKALGLDVGPVVDGRRRNQQGQWIEWKMATVGGDIQGVPLPFVIQWTQDDGVRRDQLTAAGVIQPHPVGPVVLDRGVFAVADPQGAARAWGRLLGRPVTPRGPGFEVTLNDKAFEFTSGPEGGLVRLEFRTESGSLKGRDLGIGEGLYRFL